MYTFRRGGPPQIMGILNVTPDSFSDGGVYSDTQAAAARALELQSGGADILDIGAQSTRPGHAPVPPAEELRRLVPVLAALRGRLNIPISIDTYEPEVAEACLGLGARIINDVSGTVTPAMAETVLRHGAGWVLMHNGGGAAAEPVYKPDAPTAVRAALEQLAGQALGLGLTPGQLCLDPGIGFGKTQRDNMALIAQGAHVKVPGFAYLVGASRKRVIAYAAGDSAPPAARLGGTIAAHVVAQLAGADILRTHDAAEARQAATLVYNLQLIINNEQCESWG